MKDAFEFIKSYIQEIFTVLLPGSFLLSLIIQIPRLNSAFYFLSDSIPKDHLSWVPVVIFISTAYFIGHLLLFFGSYLDETLYKIFTGKACASADKDFCDDLSKIDLMKTNGWPKSYWRKYHQLLAITECYRNQNTKINTRTFGAYKFGCAWLQLNRPEVYAMIERRTAESKFFRTMVVTFLASAFISLKALENKTGMESYMYFIFFMLLSVLAFLPYIHLRRKTIEQTCEFIITAFGK